MNSLQGGIFKLPGLIIEQIRGVVGIELGLEYGMVNTIFFLIPL